MCDGCPRRRGDVDVVIKLEHADRPAYPDVPDAGLLACAREPRDQRRLAPRHVRPPAAPLAPGPPGPPPPPTRASSVPQPPRPPSARPPSARPPSARPPSARPP